MIDKGTLICLVIILIGVLINYNVGIKIGTNLIVVGVMGMLLISTGIVGAWK